MGQAPTAARLIAPTGGTLGVISGLLRTAAGTIDLTAVAAAANKHLSPTTDTHEQPGRRRHRRGLAHAWTTIVMLGIMPRHACSARRGARRRFRTWRFRSAPCLPIWQVVNAQLCARSIASHLRRTPTCGYVDNASALPTDPQDQKTKASVNLIALKAQRSNQVNPDHQAGQPPHRSPHSVSILTAIHRRAPDVSALLNAIATYERSLLTPGSRFDRWLAGETTAISPEELSGYQLFKSLGCISCHQGVNVGGNLSQRHGIFRALGAPEPELVRVPSLRNVAATAPYFHDGSTATLNEAVRQMGLAQLDRVLTDSQISSVVAFLRTLTGTHQGRSVVPANARPSADPVPR
jgi:cytochrome c peroxidase